MSGIISIIGPTAVGKTAFANQIAKKLLAEFPQITGIDFISADSRQIYQGLEIVSGTEIPAESHLENLIINDLQIPTWITNSKKNRWFGLSAITPDQDWSVAHFRQLAQAVIPASLAENRLPIIVGGTGLYVEHAFHTDPQLTVPPDEKLRARIDDLSLTELQTMVRQQAFQRWQQMNHSDQANPRRLVRALEIAKGQPNPKLETSEDSTLSTIPQLIIGLHDSIENLEPKIEERVKDRWQAGAPQEVARILANYPNQKLPLFSATGIKPILAYLSDQIDIEQAQQLWFRQERQYAKRQLTWWKKRPNVQWFEVTQPEWKAEAHQAIAAWFRSH